MTYEHRTALFSGIIDSDGYKKSAINMKVTSISKSLILGIRMLAESLGYSTSVSYCKRPKKYKIEGRTVNQQDTYSIAIHKNSNRRTGIEFEGHRWYKCRNVIKTGETKTVYNISVEDDESYIADSIVVHNCQDLSVAGNQAGIKQKCSVCGTTVEFSKGTTCPNCGAELEFTRSGLFMEQIRIIQEMREKTNECYPKIVIWENVPGALSSNNGDDFFCVLQEFCKLMGEKIPAFRPEKWSNAGEILGESCSIAWRILDAQYWGVPQRRRRIFLVADFTGTNAGEILFKPESLRRHLTPSTVPWKRTSAEIEKSVEDTSESTVGEIKTENVEVYGVCSIKSNSMQSDNPNSGFFKTDIEKTLDTNGLNPTCNQGGNMVVEGSVYCIQGNCIDRADTAGCNGKGWKEDVSYTLTTIDRPAVAYEEKPYVAAFNYEAGAALSLNYEEEMTPTLLASQSMGVLIANHGMSCSWKEVEDGICPTLLAAMGEGGNNTPFVMEISADTQAEEFLIPPQSKSTVRRLTPLECERLQGFPDNWTESESDSARYKALGNSVALPCVDYIMSGVVDLLDSNDA